MFPIKKKRSGGLEKIGLYKWTKWEIWWVYCNEYYRALNVYV